MEDCVTLNIFTKSSSNEANNHSCCAPLLKRCPQLQWYRRTPK
jgi:hypothetical protein